MTSTHHSSAQRADWVGRQGAAALAPVVQGDMIRPGDEAFAEATKVWNGAIERRPALIVRPTSAAEVAAAVRFATQADVPVEVRGGGHNVAGLATCDDGVVIDLSAMNGVTVDPDRRRARAGGGATWGDLDRATQPHGLAAPGGLISTTGIGGLTLGGGLSWMRRKHGLSCDNLASVQIVTAEGEIRCASEYENADLFWAIRGGGGNFGVVTEFEYRLHPTGPEVMFAFVIYPLENGREVPQPTFRHGVVAGASMAGPLAARVLSDHFDRVTIVERDELPRRPEPRKGVPQARHVHVLLPAGLGVLKNLLPGLTDAPPPGPTVDVGRVGYEDC